MTFDERMEELYAYKGRLRSSSDEEIKLERSHQRRAVLKSTVLAIGAAVLSTKIVNPNAIIEGIGRYAAVFLEVGSAMNAIVSAGQSFHASEILSERAVLKTPPGDEVN